MNPEDDDIDVAAAWNANAAIWSAHVRAGYDRYRELFTLPAFLEFIPELRGLQVLDLGCGEGRNTRALARRSAAVTGVDLAERMIAPPARRKPRSRSGSLTAWLRSAGSTISRTRASMPPSRPWR